MRNQLNIMLAMQDQQFQKILENDQVINNLEKEKYDETMQFQQLMSILSKIFKINGVIVQVLTPAIWSFLYCIGSPFTIKKKKVEKIDVDIFMHILSNGISNLSDDLISDAAGFCDKNKIDWKETQRDINTFIYLSFRPLEMLPITMLNTTEQVRYNSDWLTRLVAVVAPLTNKKSDDIIFNMSLTECFYYVIQNARKNDDKNLIKRKNSDQIEAEIYMRNLQLGKKYYQDNYQEK